MDCRFAMGLGMRDSGEPATELVRLAINAPLAWILMRGHAWLRDYLQPALRKLHRTGCSPRRTKLLIRAHTMLGDLFLVLRAEEAAIAEYRRALRHAPNDPNILFEIAQAHDMHGDSAAAIRAHRAVLRVRSRFGPSNRAIAVLRREMDARADPNLARPSAEDAAFGALIAGDVCRAMASVRGRRESWARLARMRCFAAMGRHRSVLLELERALIDAGSLELTIVDWFYMPDALWDGPQLWRFLYSNKSRIKGLGVLNFCRCERLDGPPDLDFGARSWARQATTAILRLHLARTSNNIRALATIRDRFPKWEDAAVIAELLEQLGRMPSRAELAAAALARPARRRKK